MNDEFRGFRCQSPQTESKRALCAKPFEFLISNFEFTPWAFVLAHLKNYRLFRDEAFSRGPGFAISLEYIIESRFRNDRVPSHHVCHRLPYPGEGDSPP